MDSLRNSSISNDNVWIPLRSHLLLMKMYGFLKESDRNLDLEANGSDLMVLIRNLIGI